jgi:hypothetical protein
MDLKYLKESMRDKVFPELLVLKGRDFTPVLRMHTCAARPTSLILLHSVAYF